MLTDNFQANECICWSALVSATPCRKVTSGDEMFDSMRLRTAAERAT